MKTDNTGVSPINSNILSIREGNQHIQITKKASFGQRSVSFVKDIMAYCWAACKTFFTAGFVKFKLSVRQVNSFELISSFKYINIKNMHIYAGNKPNRCKDIDINSCKKVLDKQERALTKESINEIVDEFKNLKTPTLYLAEKEYKKDNEIDSAKGELTLTEALDALINSINTKLQDKTQKNNTINLFIEIDNNKLIKENLFNIYNKIYSTDEKKIQGLNYDNSTAAINARDDKTADASQSDLSIPTTTSEQHTEINEIAKNKDLVDTSPTAKQNEVSVLPTTDTAATDQPTAVIQNNTKIPAIVGASTVVNQPKVVIKYTKDQLKLYDLKTADKMNNFIKSHMLKKWPAIKKPENSLAYTLAFNNLAKTIKKIDKQKFINYVNNMPELKFIKLGFFQQNAVLKFKASVVANLMTKGYQYKECENNIQQLFETSVDKKDLDSKLGKYPNKDPDGRDLAQKLGVTPKEANDQVSKLATEISNKYQYTETSYPTTMAKYLLERNKNNKDQLKLDDLPSILKFVLGYTTEQEYEKIYKKNMQVLREKKYTESEAETIFTQHFHDYAKNDINNVIAKYPNSNKQNRIKIACIKLNLTITKFSQLISDAYNNLCTKGKIVNSNANKIFFKGRAENILLDSDDVDSFEKSILDIIPSHIDKNKKIRSVWNTISDYNEDLQFAKKTLEKKGYTEGEIDSHLTGIIAKSENRNGFHTILHDYIELKYQGLGYKNMSDFNDKFRWAHKKLADSQISSYFPKSLNFLKQYHSLHNKDQFTNLIKKITTTNNASKLINKFQKDINKLPENLEKWEM